MSALHVCHGADMFLHSDRCARRAAMCSSRQLAPGHFVRRRLLGCTNASPNDIVQAADIIIQHGPHAWNAVAGATPDATPQHGTHQELQCTLSGLDSVMCVVEDMPDEDETSTRVALPLASLDEQGSLLVKAMEIGLLISPFFFWGTSMVAMKSVVPHTTPMLLGAMRLLPAGMILVGWATASGRHQPSTLKAWAWVLAFALIDAAAFQGFLAEGLTKTSAGLGSVIIDSQPLSVAVLASLLFGERLSGVGVAGLALGVAGLALLEVPGDSLADAASAVLSGAWHPELPQPSGGLTSSGEFWMLLAAQSMAVGTVMVRYVTKHVDPIMATGWHMIIGGALLAAIAATSGGGDATAAAAAATSPLASLAAQTAHLTLEDAVSMSYVSLMGGALSYGIFFWYASHGSLTSLSSLTFLTPVFASAVGYLTLGEMLTPMQLLGGAVTLSAVWCINHRPAGAEPPPAAAAASPETAKPQ